MPDEVDTATGSALSAAEGKTSRQRFLRQLGLTFAVAVGFGAFASRAFASVGQCCEDCLRCSGCSMSNCYCYCDCSGIGDSYCWTAQPHCQAGCQTCPC